ncbi:MAG: ligand-binding sensor domain-containing protein/signal transduction histidine kinase, partial [Phenylobacterium sp.]
MRLLIYLVILLFSLSAWCQGPSVSFDRLSIEDGLSQNSLSSILQDRNGFLWFGTFDGLNRYDGYEFKVYRHNPANPNSIADDIIRTLFEDKNGNLWVGTDSGGLSRFDAKTQRFINFKHDDNNPRSLSHNRVMSITQDNHGDLWVGTYGGGLNKFNGESQDFSHFEHDPANPNSLSDNKITTIHHDGKGAIWVGTRGHGLDKYDISSKKFSHFTSDPNQPSSLSNNRIRALYVDASGDLWIGTKGGLNRYNPRQSANNKTNQDTFTRFNHKTSNPNSISSDQIRSIHQDSAGALWIGTEGSGLNKLPTLSNANFVHFENEPSNPRSISSGRINAIYEDNKGTLWVGTYGGGISKYDAQKERFGHFKHEISNPSSLNNSSIHALYVDSTDTLWVGTDRGLNRYDANQKRFTHFNHDPVNIHSISRGRINAIYEDSKGFLWVGANGSGLNRYDAKTNRFKHFVNEHSNPHSLSNDVVRTVHEDHLGTLWVGTYGGGLNRFDASTEQFSHLRHQPGNRNSLSNDLVMSIYQDSNKILWIATNGGGVNRYDISSKKFSHLLNDENDSNSLSDNRAWYIYEDMRHSLWIGTANGLNQYQHNNQNNNQNNSGQFTHYRKTDGLANNTILGISEDHAGNLWVSSNQGLSKINPTSGIIKNYNVNDGLQSNAFNQGAYFKGGDGELFFGGSNGLNRFYPHNIIDDIRKPAVAFTDFQVSNQSVPIRPDNSPDIELEVETLGQGFNPYRENNASQSTFTLSEDIQVLEHLTLTHKESQVSFAFTALDFTNPLLNQYAYQLTGWDEDWIYTDAKRRFATYTKLDAGDYVFKVKASNKDGYWNEQPKSLAITVLPPPWQTWWAYTIYTLILIAIIAAITRAEREKRRNEREVMVQLRKVDKLKDEFLANTSHELRTPLNGIIGLTESLIDGATEELNDDTKKNLAMVVTSGKRLANLVNDILDFSKLKSQDIPLNPKATDLRTSIEVTLTISATLASHKPIKLINDVPHDLVPIYADEDRLQQILFNLVGNAIKFTDEGTITITANTTTSKHGNNMIAISIS